MQSAPTVEMREKRDEWGRPTFLMRDAPREKSLELDPAHRAGAPGAVPRIKISVGSARSLAYNPHQLTRGLPPRDGQKEDLSE